MTATITTADLAATLETTPRELRKFLRSEQGPGKVGKGSRYALPATKRDIARLTKAFTAWSEAKAAKAEAEVEAPEVEVEVDEVDTDA